MQEIVQAALDLVRGGQMRVDIVKAQLRQISREGCGFIIESEVEKFLCEHGLIEKHLEWSGNYCYKPANDDVRRAFAAA